jgi:hypothetical protein
MDEVTDDTIDVSGKKLTIRGGYARITLETADCFIEIVGARDYIEVRGENNRVAVQDTVVLHTDLAPEHRFRTTWIASDNPAIDQVPDLSKPCLDCVRPFGHTHRSISIEGING